MVNIYHSLEESSECVLPSVCKIQNINIILDILAKEKTAQKSQKGLKCDVYEGYQFDVNISTSMAAQCSNLLFSQTNGSIEIRWSKNNNEILDRNINIKSLFSIFEKWYHTYSINFVNIKKFDLDLFDINNFFNLIIPSIHSVVCLSCRFDFYFNKTKLSSCQDIVPFIMSWTPFMSIFQIFKPTPGNLYGFYPIFIDLNDYTDIALVNSDFNSSLCPLVFANSFIDYFHLIGMMDTFYKRNILRFISFPNASTIYSHINTLCLSQVQNINLDLDFLNPLVFQHVMRIYIYGSINKINSEIFTRLEILNELEFLTVDFRKVMHTNGIDWIKAMNRNKSVNLTNYNDFFNKRDLIKIIKLSGSFHTQVESIVNVFPDEDFCLYEQFPFDQHTILIHHCDQYTIDITKVEFTCTYLWLTRYYPLYYKLYQNVKDTNKRYFYIVNLQRILHDKHYNSSMSKCNFEKMRNNCRNYSREPIWDRYDYFVLNKHIEVVLKICSYIISALGIVTNAIVVVVIVHKDNKENFKKFKHYDYLCANSIFCVLIALIDILSSMTECFPLFCPEIRKLVVLQLFKMVLKECLVTAFRFMCSFTYLAFALNRIALLIGNTENHSILKFISEMNVKIYLLMSLIISCGLSIIKYFKYSINFDQPETSYPISNELDLFSIYFTKISNDAYIIINSISDIINYIVFELVIFIIDVYLVVLLRRTLDEKIAKFKGLSKDVKKLENMVKENDAALNKVIRLVVLNTFVSVVLKLPIAFIPIVNVYAEFYYKNYKNKFIHPNFGEFYMFLIDSGFYDTIVECSDLFYTFSIFIQLFIYINFDKNFKAAFKKIFSTIANNKNFK